MGRLKVNGQEVAGLVRHILTTVGGVLVANGHVTGSDWELVAGAAGTLAGFGWSIMAKRGWRF